MTDQDQQAEHKHSPTHAGEHEQHNHHYHSTSDPAISEDDNDDVWDDGDNLEYDRAIAEREWDRLHDTFGNTGYREGIEEGKEGTLQQGFNQGWSEGVEYGHALGQLRGLISPVLEYLRSPSSTALSNSSSTLQNPEDKDAWIKRATVLVQELVELDISKVFDKAYFDDRVQPTAAAAAAASSAVSTGCCGGGDGDTCCKKDSTSLPALSTAKEENAEGSGSTSGVSQSKGEWSSTPERVVGEYRARVRDLLKEIGLDALLQSA
ncbi:hypothetical protein BGZ99_006713 [Dissophora globulifera]|uniref:Protein YAE1 n=1 Tax=Dissophora globulifera TaxID=979702 RepID=A0A9P6RCS0_9FUNG|nr:hypothetical protein BGZ99_006713 [Dissophora globulifera]